MATVKIYLDKRIQKKDGTYPVKLTITHKRTFHMSVGISVYAENWIGNKVEGNIPNKNFINSFISARYTTVENLLLKLKLVGELATINDKQLKDIIREEWGEEKKVKREENPLQFYSYVMRHMNTYQNDGTKQQYRLMLNKVAAFCDTKKLLISDITVSWLKDFDAFCGNTGMTANGKGYYMRAIRTIYNDAIDRELISYDKYPFRRFKIKRTETRHRNMSVEDLREIVDFNEEAFVEKERLTANKHTNVFPKMKKYIDLFMLSFYLCGMNIKDVLFLKDTDIRNGRLSIMRAKTNTHILLDIVPEAQRIIDQYKGKKYLLNFLDSYTTDDYRSFTGRMNRNIQRAFPNITTYWARHTWATIAAELDVPDQTIDIAQGRKPQGMASIYINRDLKKVSKANRKVIDYVLGK